MDRKHALLTLLFLYAISGILICVFYLSGIRPEDQDTTMYATLSPAEIDTEPVEAELPTTVPGIEETQTLSDLGESDYTEAEPEYIYEASHWNGRLFIREGPGLDYKIIGYMPSGSKGDVISLGDDWVNLRYDDIEGYSYRGYLTITEKEPHNP